MCLVEATYLFEDNREGMGEGVAGVCDEGRGASCRGAGEETWAPNKVPSLAGSLNPVGRGRS